MRRPVRRGREDRDGEFFEPADSVRFHFRFDVPPESQLIHILSREFAPGKIFQHFFEWEDVRPGDRVGGFRSGDRPLPDLRSA